MKKSKPNLFVILMSIFSFFLMPAPTEATTVSDPPATEISKEAVTLPDEASPGW